MKVGAIRLQVIAVGTLGFDDGDEKKKKKKKGLCDNCLLRMSCPALQGYYFQTHQHCPPPLPPFLKEEESREKKGLLLYFLGSMCLDLFRPFFFFILCA